MKVTLSNIGKRYDRNWIVRKVDHTFHSGNAYALLGHNGSGKSTLLQLISGFLLPSEGSIGYHDEQGIIDPNRIFQQVSIAAPYLELHEQFTLKELLDFYGRFRRYRDDSSSSSIIRRLGLEEAADRELRHFSSGMVQRVKLGIAILSDTPILLLDEPTTNLDEDTTALYRDLLSSNRDEHRTVLIASNEKEAEYDMCDQVLMIRKKRLVAQ